MQKAKNQQLQLSDEKSLMAFLKEPTVRIAETLTGILISEQKDWKLSAGKVVQAAIKGSLLTQLGREIEDYRMKGKIKEDYFATHKNRATLYELLKFLDEDIPDDELFTALKSIFFSGIQKSATTLDEALAYEFLQTAKKLSGTEILILKANSELAQGEISDAVNPDVLGNAQSKRSVWKRVIAKQMGYGEMHAIVSKYESNLSSLGLISPQYDNAQFSDEFEPTQKFRLSEMGYKFCEFMTNYP